MRGICLFNTAIFLFYVLVSIPRHLGFAATAFDAIKQLTQ